MLKNKYLTKVCLALLLILFSMEVFEFSILSYIKILFINIENGADSEVDYNFLEWYSNYEDKLLGFYYLILIILGVFYLIWSYQAHSNLSQLGAKNLRYSSASVIWWWFIPIANLWKPYSVFKEIMIQSQKLAYGSVHNEKFGIFLLVWWVLHFPSRVLGGILKRMGDPDTISKYQSFLDMGLFLLIFEIFMSVIIFYLIYNVDKWQQKANQSKYIINRV